MQPSSDARVALPAGVALHARPAGQLVRAASRFEAAVAIEANGRRANARSILELLSLGAGGGSELAISATGVDADAAVVALAELIRGLA